MGRRRTSYPEVNLPASALWPFPNVSHKINKEVGMQPEASLKFFLMDRQVCKRCHHFHRVVLARFRKCECCYKDATGKEMNPK